MSRRSIVIVGAGHAGVQAAASLREEGNADEIVAAFGRGRASLPTAAAVEGLSQGRHGPRRPAAARRAILSRPRHRFASRRAGARASTGGRSAFELSSGGAAPFDHLILATGARPRPLDAPGLGLGGVLGLRAIVDAQAIRERLGPGRRVVVVGAGFIGLEFAATALALGGDVTIVEVAERPLGRAVSAPMSSFFLEAHRAFGAKFRFGVGLASIEGSSGEAEAVTLSNGERVAGGCRRRRRRRPRRGSPGPRGGLDCANGIVVDDFLVASDPAISAIGDCAQFPSASTGAPARLESVQNAVDQARCVARRLTGKPEPYDALPWFWSDQGDLKLQIAGLSHGVDRWTVRGDPQSRAFAVFGFRGPTLAAVETVNRGADHMAARRIIAGALPLTPEQAGDPQFDLRKLALSAKA